MNEICEKAIKHLQDLVDKFNKKKKFVNVNNEKSTFTSLTADDVEAMECGILAIREHVRTTEGQNTTLKTAVDFKADLMDRLKIKYAYSPKFYRELEKLIDEIPLEEME